MTASADIDA